jgi:hypothetical protein
MSRTLLSLAGFQVILSGRFWVIAEVDWRKNMKLRKSKGIPSNRVLKLDTRTNFGSPDERNAPVIGTTNAGTTITPPGVSYRKFGTVVEKPKALLTEQWD